MKPIISIIAVMGANGVIGKDGKIPWYIPEELQHFKRMTMGKPVIMGRKTYESIGKPLPGRTNIVITRDPEWRVDGVIRCGSIESAIAAVPDAKEVMIIGGAEIYEQTIDIADRIYLSIVIHDGEGDAYFPDVSEGDWEPTGHISFYRVREDE